MNPAEKLSVIKIRDILIVTLPPDPDDATIAALQEAVLDAMQRYDAKGVILDISPVDTLDSFFARTISETAQMVGLMGGKTIVTGMRPAVAVAATEIGLTLQRIQTALNVDRALDMIREKSPKT